VGFRETINENRQTVTGITIGLIVVGIGLIVWQMMPARVPGPPTQCFFSDDDGAHWFADDINKIPPFSHNGHTAVRAYVFRWSGGDFVGYLEKYPDKIRDKLQAIPPGPLRDAFFNDNPNCNLVKRPGAAYWAKPASRDGIKILGDQRPPNGNPEIATPVFP
jgi:hypothetical protein